MGEGTTLLAGVYFELNRSMSFAAVLFAPLVTLLPAGGPVQVGVREISVAERAADEGSFARQRRQLPSDIAHSWTIRHIAEGIRAQPQNQVRIEQHTTIRIAPRPRSLPLQPNMLMELRSHENRSRFAERKIGRCLPASSIAGVQPGPGHRLILFLRDRRMVGAELDRTCHARDFYSGFYVAGSPDGQICIDRDMLLSRSGANCKLTRIRQLVESED